MGESLTTLTATFPEILMGFCSGSRDVIGHVTVRLAMGNFVSYWCFIGTDTLSPRISTQLRLKCILVTVLTFLGQVSDVSDVIGHMIILSAVCGFI